MDQRITKSINLSGNNPENKRTEIPKYFHDSFNFEKKLFATLRRNETYFFPANPLCHPLIFYFGHTAAFYINKLALAKILNEKINSKLESMFAVGVDEMSWSDLTEAHFDWPSVQEAEKNKNKVQNHIEKHHKRFILTLPTGQENPF